MSNRCSCCLLAVACLLASGCVRPALNAPVLNTLALNAPMPVELTDDCTAFTQLDEEVTNYLLPDVVFTPRLRAEACAHAGLEQPLTSPLSASERSRFEYYLAEQRRQLAAVGRIEYLTDRGHAIIETHADALLQDFVFWYLPLANGQSSVIDLGAASSYARGAPEDVGQHLAVAGDASERVLTGRYGVLSTASGDAQLYGLFLAQNATTTHIGRDLLLAAGRVCLNFHDRSIGQRCYRDRLSEPHTVPILQLLDGRLLIRARLFNMAESVWAFLDSGALFNWVSGDLCPATERTIYLLDSLGVKAPHIADTYVTDVALPGAFRTDAHFERVGTVCEPAENTTPRVVLGASLLQRLQALEIDLNERVMHLFLPPSSR